MDNGLRFPYRRQTLYEAVTQEDSSSARMEKCVQGEAQADSEVRLSIKRSADGERNREAKRMNPRWREKPLNSLEVPVPQTDTGRREENSKTNGRTIVKELGKMTP